MTRRKSFRIRRPSPFCSTDEYKRKMERFDRRFELASRAQYSTREERQELCKSAKEKRFIEHAVAPRDMRVDQLRELAAHENKNNPCRALDPLEVDHIWPIEQGGPDIYENLRLVPHSWNTRRKRTRREIEAIILVEAVNRGFKPWILPDNFKEPWE